MQKNFSLQKNNYKKSDSQPDYNISIKVGEKYMIGGGGWIKKDKNGATYLFCKLGDRYTDNIDTNKSRNGFHIAIDAKTEEGEAQPEELDTITSAGTDNNKIPF